MTDVIGIKAENRKSNQIENMTRDEMIEYAAALVPSCDGESFEETAQRLHGMADDRERCDDLYYDLKSVAEEFEAMDTRWWALEEQYDG